jgi:DNA polymerase-3 subunit beta
MKFITEKAQIVDSLQNAAAVAERRQTIPILANLRLKTVNGKLEVTATDLEIQIKTFSDLIKIEEEGETTVSARKMSELCRSLPEG